MFGIFRRMILWELLKVFVMSLLASRASCSWPASSPRRRSKAWVRRRSWRPFRCSSPALCPTPSRPRRCSPPASSTAGWRRQRNPGHQGGGRQHHQGGLTPALRPRLVMSGLPWASITASSRTRTTCSRPMVFNDAEEFLYAMLRQQNQHRITSSIAFYAMCVEARAGSQADRPGRSWAANDRRARSTWWPCARRRSCTSTCRTDADHPHAHTASSRRTTASTRSFKDNAFDPVELPTNFGAEGDAAPPRDMTWEEILQNRRLDSQARSRTWTPRSRGISRHARPGRAGTTMPQAHQEPGTETASTSNSRSSYLDVELLMRPALSVGCLCFILVGCPVGIWFSRSDYLSAFIICFLADRVRLLPADAVRHRHRQGRQIRAALARVGRQHPHRRDRL